MDQAQHANTNPNECVVWFPTKGKGEEAADGGLRWVGIWPGECKRGGHLPIGANLLGGEETRWVDCSLSTLQHVNVCTHMLKKYVYKHNQTRDIRPAAFFPQGQPRMFGPWKREREKSRWL